MKLNLGAGGFEIPGFTALDIKQGQGAFPLLAYQDNSVEVIRASHLLEHFSYHRTLEVIREWTRVLAPGGWLRIAVPNLEWIIERYEDGQPRPDGQPWNLEGFLFGGHSDNHDVHLATFSDQKLRDLFAAAGLVNVRPWTSEINDCAALPVSLNLEAQKPMTQPAGAPAMPQNLKISAAISVPRLGFQEHFLCLIDAVCGFGMKLRKYTGAYWGHGLTQAMMESLSDNPDLIMTLDYDTIFNKGDVETMIRIMAAHPEIDALAPLQSHRALSSPLFTVKGADGLNITEMTNKDFAGEVKKISTAHFGLTFIRAAKLRAMPHPWFQDIPDKDGMWGEGSVDDDIYFWRQWGKAGNSLYIANRVTVGHAELMIRWPGKDMGTIYQSVTDWTKEGKPKEIWK